MMVHIWHSLVIQQQWLPNNIMHRVQKDTAIMTKIHIENLDRDVEIKKLPLGKYSELIKSIDKDLPDLFKQFEGLDMDDNEGMLKQLPEIIANALPQFAQILSIATYYRNEKREQVRQLSPEDVMDDVALDEAVDLMMAAWEVNGLKKLADKAKKWMPSKPGKGSNPAPAKQ